MPGALVASSMTALPLPGDADAEAAVGPEHGRRGTQPADRPRQALRARPLDLGDLRADGRPERGRRPVGHRATAREQDHPVGGLRLGEIVRGEEDRGAALAPLGAEDGPDQLAMLGIEADGGLVQDEQVRPVQRGAGDVDQPPPPARELPRRLRRERAEPGPLDGRGDRGAAARARPGRRGGRRSEGSPRP